MPRKPDDTDPDFRLPPPASPLTGDKAIALMQKGMWSSSNANSADGQQVEYVTVFSDAITAQDLPLETTTQAPFGRNQQVTSWGAIRHTENQYEVPLAILEAAAGKTAEEVAPKLRPRNAGSRDRSGRAVRDEPATLPDPVPPTPTNPPTREQAIALMQQGTWSKGNAHVADRSRHVELVTILKGDITAQGLPLNVTTQAPFGETRQVTSWGCDPGNRKPVRRPAGNP